MIKNGRYCVNGTVQPKTYKKNLYYFQEERIMSNEKQVEQLTNYMANFIAHIAKNYQMMSSQSSQS